jgi:Ca2+-binding RTX toxin-like protein
MLRVLVLRGALAATGVALAGAGPAVAATIDYSGTTLSITGTAGPEYLLLSQEDAGVEVKSFNGGQVGPGAAAVCQPGGEEYLWVCPRPARIVATLGAGDDDLAVYEGAPFTVPMEVDGGPGDDRLWGASGADALSGGPGDDRLSGGGGADRLLGGDGNDLLTGRTGDDLLDGGAGDDSLEDGFAGPLGAADLDAGADTYIGGPGDDRFSYFGRGAPVSVTLDGVADDGEAGEHDDVHPDIEVVGGGSGDDVLVGSAGADHLWGSDGNDVLLGGGGDDRLDGNDGDDRLDGGPGGDTLDGGCMTDTLIGGPGRDSFQSDGSCSSLLLRSPVDRIEARDGEPDALIFCQRLGDPAGDVAVVDAVDPVSTAGPGACATVSAPPPVQTPPPSAGPAAPKPPQGAVRARLGTTARLLVGTGRAGAAAAQRIELKRKRVTLGTLAATARTRVKVTASTRKRGRTIVLGRRTVTLAAGRATTLRLPLSKRGRSALAGQRRASVAVAFTVGKKTYRATFRIAVRRI